jgi:hypothetical protein
MLGKYQKNKNKNKKNQKKQKGYAPTSQHKIERLRPPKYLRRIKIYIKNKIKYLKKQKKDKKIYLE